MAVRAANWTGQNTPPDWGSASAEWPTLYSQYLMGAASQSARTLELYQQVMDCVARKELAPTVLQDMQPAFVQARGTAYSNRFAEITMRFFAGMIQIGTAYTNEMSDLVAPGATEPPLQPPPLNIADPVNWFQRISEYATQLNARAVRDYQSLLERVATGNVTPAQLQEVSSSYIEQRLPDHMRRLTVLYFDLLNGLGDLQAGYQEEFLEGVLATINQEESFVLNLIAPLGEMASASVSLTNTTDAPTTIRCVASDIRRADGVGPAFAPQLTITPDSRHLQPDEEASLVISLQLDADDFDPDVWYVGDLHITGHSEPRFEVPIRIKATPVGENATSDGSA